MVSKKMSPSGTRERFFEMRHKHNVATKLADTPTRPNAMEVQKASSDDGRCLSAPCLPRRKLSQSSDAPERLNPSPQCRYPSPQCLNPSPQRLNPSPQCFKPSSQRLNPSPQGLNPSPSDNLQLPKKKLAWMEITEKEEKGKANSPDGSKLPKNVAMKCICHICNCGTHKCRQGVRLTSHQTKDTLGRSEYKSNFDQKVVRPPDAIRPLPAWQQLVQRFSGGCGRSVYKTDYLPVKALPKTEVRKLEETNEVLPSSGATATSVYKTDFINKVAARRRPFKPVEVVAAGGGGEFQGLSVYKRDFQPKKPLEKVLRKKYCDEPSLPSGQFQGLSVYKADFRSPVGGVPPTKSCRPQRQVVSHPGARTGTSEYNSSYDTKDPAQPCPVTVMYRTNNRHSPWVPRDAVRRCSSHEYFVADKTKLNRAERSRYNVDNRHCIHPCSSPLTAALK